MALDYCKFMYRLLLEKLVYSLLASVPSSVNWEDISTSFIELQMKWNNESEPLSKMSGVTAQ